MSPQQGSKRPLTPSQSERPARRVRTSPEPPPGHNHSHDPDHDRDSLHGSLYHSLRESLLEDLQQCLRETVRETLRENARDDRPPPPRQASMREQAGTPPPPQQMPVHEQVSLREQAATPPQPQQATQPLEPVVRRGPGRPRMPRPLEPAVKRPPGRPRKNPPPQTLEPVVKRPPGRPRKNPLPEQATQPLEERRVPVRPPNNPHAPPFVISSSSSSSDPFGDDGDGRFEAVEEGAADGSVDGSESAHADSTGHSQPELSRERIPAPPYDSSPLPTAEMQSADGAEKTTQTEADNTAVATKSAKSLPGKPDQVERGLYGDGSCMSWTKPLQMDLPPGAEGGFEFGW